MVINLRGLDKYEINHTGDGQKYGRTRTEVRTVNIYEFVRLNVVYCGITKRRTLMERVIIDTFLHALTHGYPWYELTYL